MSQQATFNPPLHMKLTCDDRIHLAFACDGTNWLIAVHEGCAPEWVKSWMIRGVEVHLGLT